MHVFGNVKGLDKSLKGSMNMAATMDYSGSPKRVYSKELVIKSASYTSNFATQRNYEPKKVDQQFQSIEDKAKKIQKKRTNPCLQELKIAGLNQGLTQSTIDNDTSNNFSYSMSFE